jgi:hypothetical protein
MFWLILVPFTSAIIFTSHCLFTFFALADTRVVSFDKFVSFGHEVFQVADKYLLVADCLYHCIPLDSYQFDVD